MNHLTLSIQYNTIPPTNLIHVGDEGTEEVDIHGLWGAWVRGGGGGCFCFSKKIRVRGTENSQIGSRLSVGKNLMTITFNK